MPKPLYLAALLSLLGSSQLSAQSQSVYVDIAPCIAMATATGRHDCYVSLGEEARSAMVSEAGLPAPSVQREPQSPQRPTEIAESNAGNQQVEAAGEFGLEQPSAVATRVSTARILATEDGGQELVDTIAKLDERMPNMWEVTLSNDQVWRQVNSEIYRLQEGMEVRIYPSPFSGSFRMSATGKNGFIQVRRIK